VRYRPKIKLSRGDIYESPWLSDLKRTEYQQQKRAFIYANGFDRPATPLPFRLSSGENTTLGNTHAHVREVFQM
jgi:hypothetical protein